MKRFSKSTFHSEKQLSKLIKLILTDPSHAPDIKAGHRVQHTILQSIQTSYSVVLTIINPDLSVAQTFIVYFQPNAQGNIRM